MRITLTTAVLASVGISGILCGITQSAFSEPLVYNNAYAQSQKKENTVLTTEKSMQEEEAAKKSVSSVTKEYAQQSDTETYNTIPAVPFYSQFNDISDPSWQKLGCGIASLAMLIDFYNEEAVSVDNLLKEGIAAGAYIQNAGWSHQGLVNLAEEHGLTGAPQDLSYASADTAFQKFKEALVHGPVIASVHYTFDPRNPIPHLVVINSVEGNTVHYNDPAESKGGGSITTDVFKAAWKKRYIVVRPEA